MPALGQHHDAVGQPYGLVEVVGHEHDRLAYGALQSQELVLEPDSHDRVDRRERLVHQQDDRIGGQRPGDADALVLTAGQLVRVARCRTGPGRGRRVPAARSTRARMRSFGQPSSRGTVATFAAIVWCGNSPTCWMTYPIRRRRSTASAVRMSSPSSRILPLVGSISRLIMRRIVDLPQPDGPISATSSPAGTSSDSDVTATVPSSYCLPTPSKVIVAAFGDGRGTVHVCPSSGPSCRARRAAQRPRSNPWFSWHYIQQTLDRSSSDCASHVRHDDRGGGRRHDRRDPARGAVLLGAAACRADSRTLRRALHDPVPGAVRLPGPVHRHRRHHDPHRTRALCPAAHHSNTLDRPATSAGGRPATRPTGWATAGSACCCRVELPLALPGIITGIRLATVSTVALLTVGVIVGQGGLGQLIAQRAAHELQQRRPDLHRHDPVRGARAGARSGDGAGIGRLITPWARRGRGVNFIHQAILWLNDPLNWTNPGGIIDDLRQHLWHRRSWRCWSPASSRLPLGIWFGHSRPRRRVGRRVVQHDPGHPDVRAARGHLVVGIAGIGAPSVVPALAIFAIPPILANAYTGIRAGRPGSARRGPRHGHVRLADAAVGSSCRWRCRTSRPGIRTAAVQIVATATLAALVAGGGLGNIIYAGFGLDHRGRWRADPRRRHPGGRARAARQRSARIVVHYVTPKPLRTRASTPRAPVAVERIAAGRPLTADVPKVKRSKRDDARWHGVTDR